MELRLEEVGRRYGSRWAVRNLSLDFGSELVGLLGPNGSGKTTLMRMIATLLEPSEGAITWNGRNLRTCGPQLRRVLGYLPQEFGIYPEFTGRQFLRYLAAMKGLPRPLAHQRVDELIEVVNLERDANRRLTAYSGGMKQRIGIAQALLNDPEVLIVDEPTAGLDPEERVRFRTLLASLTTARVVLLSTHIVGDVEAAASRLIVLRSGCVLADTTPQELIQRASGSVWELTVDMLTARQLQERYQISAMIQRSDGIQMHVITTEQPMSGARPVQPDLEEAYLFTIGEKA
ncbi:MAG: ABC transporter ATP-binding protein [Chloroflexi bacterium]|nr:MAG: ABC transporter ATP-binding protein [Chloroflexota bacterium]